MINEKEKNAVIDISSSGSNAIITAPGDGKYLAIDHINLLASSAVDITFYTGDTTLSGTYAFDSKQAMALDNSWDCQDGVITCGNNEAFNITLGAAVQVSGFIRYRIINE